MFGFKIYLREKNEVISLVGVSFFCHAIESQFKANDFHI